MNWLYQNDRVWLLDVLPEIKRVDRETRRKSFKELLKEFPEANRTRLKKLGKGVYRWLYHHDRDWLEDHLPARTR